MSKSAVKTQMVGKVEAAKALAPVLSELAAGNEVAGRLTEETIETLRRADLLYYLVPKCVGGGEVWPTEALEIVEAISYGDGSTGWVSMAQNAVMAGAAAYLPDSAFKHIFSDGIPFMAGQHAPAGRAQCVPGGYRLTGTWGYGSGVLHADWVRGGGFILEKDGGFRKIPGTDEPEHITFIFPKDQVEVKGNWDVMGLIATGSCDFSVKDILIPPEYATSIRANTPLRGGDAYRLGIMGTVVIIHTAFSLGIAKRMLDEIREISMNERRPTNLPVMGGGDAFHDNYGLALARYHAARAFAIDWCEKAEEMLRRAQNLSPEQQNMGFLMVNAANESAMEIARMAYFYSGGTGLRRGVMQRAFRDQHASSQHIINSRIWLRNAVRQLIGLKEAFAW